jgi:glycosyltransferase involved in cell wall biosynthesis
LCLLETATGLTEECTVVLFEHGPFEQMLIRAGVTVQVLSAPRALQEVRRDGRVAPVRVALGLVRLAGRVAALARHFDVLYANSQKSMLVAAIAGVLARRPVVWHLHDLLTQEHFGHRQVRVAVGVGRLLARRVIANSVATRDAYVLAGGRADHVQVVYNGIDATPFDQADEESARVIRNELGLGGAPLVGLFGRIAPWKGHAVLLDALASLPGVHALLVGGALFEGDKRYPALLRSRIEALSLSDRVHKLGFRSDIPALMKACDVIVHASTAAEPFGRVIVEGMLAGRPVIAAAAGGARELVDDGVNGLLVEPGDSASLAAAIRRALMSGESERLAAAGYASALDRFSPGRIRTQVAAVLAEAVARSSGLSGYWGRGRVPKV